MMLPFTNNLLNAAIKLLGMRDFSHFTEEGLKILERTFYVVDVEGLYIWSGFTTLVGFLFGTILGIGVKRDGYKINSIKKRMKIRFKKFKDWDK